MKPLVATIVGLLLIGCLDSSGSQQAPGLGVAGVVSCRETKPAQFGPKLVFCSEDWGLNIAQATAVQDLCESESSNGAVFAAAAAPCPLEGAAAGCLEARNTTPFIQWWYSADPTVSVSSVAQMCGGNPVVTPP